MRYSPLFIFTLIAASLCINSCKNDLKLNAPYKEIPSVYAVLNPQEKIQMIRVNKVFLGEGDANVMAQVADSVNYQAGDLTITLERYVSDVKSLATPTGNKDVITFRDSLVQTGEGAFARTQRVYVTGDKLFTFGVYQLKIYNNHTKNTFTAKANAIDSVPPGIGPLTLGHYYGDTTNIQHLGDPTIWIDYSKPGTSYAVRFSPTPTLATVFQLNMRFHYIDSLVTGNTEEAYVDFDFTRLTSKDITYGNGGAFIIYGFKGSDVYDAVASSLSKNSRSLSDIDGRRMFKISYMIYSSTQEYEDYLQYTAPSLSIAQEKPFYSNFDNNAALGIFAFRARHFIQREMDSQFKDEFANNPTTCHYKFMIVSNGVPHLNPLCH